MLGHTYRYHVVNSTGVSVTFTVAERAWKFDSNGARVDASEATRISASSVSSLGAGSSSAIDNRSTLNLGADVLLTATPASSVTGVVSLYLQRSTDAGTTWPSAGNGELVAVMSFVSSSATQTTSAEV